jgi:hypothetical protein
LDMYRQKSANLIRSIHADRSSITVLSENSSKASLNDSII